MGKIEKKIITDHLLIYNMNPEIQSIIDSFDGDSLEEYYESLVGQ